MTKKVIVAIVAILALTLAACGKKDEPIQVDYANENLFEEALVNGEDPTGKVVVVTVGDLKTQSVFGYDIWAGEHLNFVSDNNPEVKAGDIITLRVTEVKSMLGSWIISYEKITVTSGE